MNIKSLLTISTAIATGLLSASVLAKQCNGIQCVSLTNLLNKADKTPIKVNVYDSGRKCYTLGKLPYGKKVQFTVMQNDPDCKVISSLVITPLGKNKQPIKMNINGDASIILRK